MPPAVDSPTPAALAPETPRILRPEFPVWGVRDDGSCRCGDPKCSSQGKHPKYNDWYYHDHPIAPGDHVGFRTGRASGIGIVDLDTDKGRDLESCHREWAALFAPDPPPRTFTVRTPSGGYHYHFRLPPDFTFTSTIRKLGQHIDTRGDTSQGVIHGKGYEVLTPGLPPAPMPPAVVRWMEEYNARKATSGPAQMRPAKVAPPPRGSEAWKNALEILANAWPPEGARHDARLALGGACLWWWQDVEATVAFVSDLDALAGGQNSEARLREPIEHAAGRMSAGMKVQGWGELYEHVGFDEGERARRVLGMKDPPLELFRLPERAADVPEDPKARRASHAYTFYVGTLTTQKTRRATASELHHYLMRHPSWNDPTPVLWFDARRLIIRAFNPPVRLAAEGPEGWQDTDTEAVRGWLECTAGICASTDEVFKAVSIVARERHFDPVVEYLDSLHRAPSGRAIYELTECMGIQDPIEAMYVYVFLVGAVARAYQPGCRVRTMLVLEGEQLDGKSEWAKTMFGDEHFVEDLPDLRNKDAMQILLGIWGVEVPELDEWLKYDVSTKKKFLSKVVDTFRPPYGRGMVNTKRGCVFVGTTNEKNILHDPTGETRYLPVHVQRMDMVRIRLLRDAVWAEARDAYRHWVDTGRVEGAQPWWVPRELSERVEAQKLLYSEVDVWEAPVRAYLKGKESVESSGKVYLEAIANFDPKAITAVGQKDLRRMAGILKRLGCEKTRLPGVGRVVYRVPAGLQ